MRRGARTDDQITDQVTKPTGHALGQATSHSVAEDSGARWLPGDHGAGAYRM